MSVIPRDRRTNAVLLGIGLFISNALINGAYNGPLHDYSHALFWTVDLLWYVVVPGFVFWFLYKRFQISPADYGLRVPPPLALELIGSSLFFGAILFLILRFVAMVVWRLQGYPATYFSYAEILSNYELRPILAIYFGVTAGVVESVCYIGLPWLIWPKIYFGKKPEVSFACCSTLLFAASHWEQGLAGVAGTMAFGLGACFLYLKIRDLWPIVGAHALADIFAFW